MQNKQSPHAGHRARMKRKFSELSDRAFSDHELLELLLFYVIPIKNVNETAHALIDRFGSLEGVLLADSEQLCLVNGIGKASADYLVLIGRTLQRTRAQAADFKQIFSSASLIGEFLVQYFHECRKEKLCAVLFDKQMKLIKIIELECGGPTEVSVSPQNIARAAVMYEASSVLIAHNHPGGCLEPSAADQSLSHLVDVTLRAVGVPLIDHVIVSGSEYAFTMVSSQNTPRYTMYAGIYGATFAKKFISN